MCCPRVALWRERERKGDEPLSRGTAPWHSSLVPPRRTEYSTVPDSGEHDLELSCVIILGVPPSFDRREKGGLTSPEKGYFERRFSGTALTQGRWRFRLRPRGGPDAVRDL